MTEKNGHMAIFYSSTVSAGDHFSLWILAIMREYPITKYVYPLVV